MTKLPSRFHFISAETKEAIKATHKLISIYGHSSLEETDIVVAIGGDGTMLQTVRDVMNTGKPIYGMNQGSVGFLMNEFHEKNYPIVLLSLIKKKFIPCA